MLTRRFLQGLATTRFLSKSGARVILASRTQSKVKQAIKDLISEDAALESRLWFVKLDLSSLEQVKEAAEEVLSKEGRLDGLVNNAGVMASPYELTEVSWRTGSAEKRGRELTESLRRNRMVSSPSSRSTTLDIGCSLRSSCLCWRRLLR